MQDPVSALCRCPVPCTMLGRVNLRQCMCALPAKVLNNQPTTFKREHSRPFWLEDAQLRVQQGWRHKVDAQCCACLHSPEQLFS